MPRFSLNVFTNCTDPARHDEFNSWYSHVHVKDLSGAYGFERARRFEYLQASGDEARYFSQYEFISDDPNRSALSLLEHAMQAFESGRHIDCIAPAQQGGGVMWTEILAEHLAAPDERHMAYPTRPPAYLSAAIEKMRAKLI